jgi:hypothetical protein
MQIRIRYTAGEGQAMRSTRKMGRPSNQPREGSIIREREAIKRETSHRIDQRDEPTIRKAGISTN